jgi:hypothetical protein
VNNTDESQTHRLTGSNNPIQKSSGSEKKPRKVTVGMAGLVKKHWLATSHELARPIGFGAELSMLATAR